MARAHHSSQPAPSMGPARRPPRRTPALLDLQRSAGNRAVGRLLARDIKDSKKLSTGTFEIDFKSHDATAAGDRAWEKGTVKFTPAADAPESDSIRFVQIVRTTDTTGAKEVDYVWPGSEAPRNKQMTAATKDVQGGFYVDQQA
jgi:hypothetical protein